MTALQGCPNRVGYWWLERNSGRVAAAGCAANRCGHCGPTKARWIGAAIAVAHPERFGTLTQVGDEWQTVRGRMRRLNHDLQERVGPSKWCWHVEPNPRGTGHHVHFWQRGSYLPQSVLSDRADAWGMGRVSDIRRWRSPPQRALQYGMKLAGIGYGMKLAEAQTQLAGYLAANGGRLVHTSRGWWLTPKGVPTTQREAVQGALRAIRPADRDADWVLCRGLVEEGWRALRPVLWEDPLKAIGVPELDQVRAIPAQHPLRNPVPPAQTAFPID